MTGNQWFDGLQQLVRDATGNGHVERLEWGMDRPESWERHLYRYGLAASLVRRGDVVLDAACGNGYGRGIIEGAGATWFGADKSPPSGRTFVVDLETWVPLLPYDVFIGLETIEHLADPAAYLSAAKKASRTVILSTPIVPTTQFNHWHIKDYTKKQIDEAFSDWTLEHYECQAGIYGVWVFARSTLPKFRTASELDARVAKLENAQWQPDEIERATRGMRMRDPRLPIPDA